MRKSLAVDRMESRHLWTLMVQNLRWLANARLGEFDYFERVRMARQSLECAEELRLRGSQGEMFPR